MGDPLAGWQDQYYMIATTAITDSPDFAIATRGAYGSGGGQVFLRNHPTFSLGQEAVASRKATGKSYLMKDASVRIERSLGVQNPTTTYEMDWDNESAFIPLHSLFQTDVAAATGATTVKTFAPYSGATVTNLASLLRFTESSKCHQIDGAIARSITISGEEGDSVQISTEWVGADMTTAVTVTPAGWTTGESLDFLLFKDMYCATGATSVSGNEVDIVGFDITITNNAVSKHYNNYTMQRHILGDFEVTGSIRIPWSSTNWGTNTLLTKLKDGNDFLLYLYWGTCANAVPAANGDMSITLNIENDSVELSGGEEEAINEISFTGIYDGTSYPISIQMLDALDRTGY